MENKTSKKILLAINDLRYGGGERTVVEEANRLFERGHEISVLLTRAKERSLELFLKIPKENIYALHFTSFFDLSSWLKLRKIMRKIKPEIVVSNLFFTNILMRTQKIFFPKLKIFVREGNIPVEKSRRVRLIDRLQRGFTEKIIVNSEKIKKNFIENLNIPETKIKILRNGVAEEYFGVSHNQEAREKAGYNIKETVLLTVASLNSKKKGHIFLLEAIKKLEEKGQAEHLTLLVIGEGRERTNLETYVKNEHLEEIVKFTGGVHNISDWLSLGDIFVLPSLWEGLPNALLEAMAAGVPIIATKVGGVPEVITDNQNGFLVSPANVSELAEKITYLRQNPELARKIGEIGKETVKRYSWTEHVQELEKIII